MKNAIFLIVKKFLLLALWQFCWSHFLALLKFSLENVYKNFCFSPVLNFCCLNEETRTATARENLLTGHSFFPSMLNVIECFIILTYDEDTRKEVGGEKWGEQITGDAITTRPDLRRLGWALSARLLLQLTRHFVSSTLALKSLNGQLTITLHIRRPKSQVIS